MRTLLRALSPLLGLVVAAIGGFVALEVVNAWVRPSGGPLLLPWQAWQAAVRGWAWASVPVRLIAVALSAAGLLLVVLALRAGRREVRLINPAPEITVTTSPRSLARLVGRQVRELDHVAAATVTATAYKISVRVQTHDADDAARSDIAEAVHTLLAELPLTHTPQVSVAVRNAEKPA